MSKLRTIFYTKNLPAWERTLRIVVALAMASYPLLVMTSPWRWMISLSGVLLGLTGLMGICPMCLLAGRRMVGRSEGERSP